MITASYTLVSTGPNPTLNLATVNTLNMIIGMWLSPLFTITMSNSPNLPWIIMAIASVVPLILLIKVKRND